MSASAIGCCCCQRLPYSPPAAPLLKRPASPVGRWPASVPAARRGWTWKLAPVGSAYAATLVLFVLATRLTTAANAIFLQSTAPLYLLLLAPLLLDEPIHRSDLLFIAAVAVGMALVLLGGDRAAATAPNPALGNR